MIKNPDIPLILPVVPIREGVLFPSTESVLTFGRPISLKALNATNDQQKMMVLLTQKDPTVNNPVPQDLYQIGTLVIVEKKMKTDETTNALVRGIGRVQVKHFATTKPHFTAHVERLTETTENSDEMKALTRHLEKEFRNAVHMGKSVEFLNFMKLMGGVTDGELADQIASTLVLKTADKQKILETTDVKTRVKLVIDKLAHEMKVLEIEKDVVHKTQKKFDKHMRDSVLRERLKTIQKELGDIEDEEEMAEDYQKQLSKLKVVADIKKKIKKELKRLNNMSPNNPESGYIRTWIETIFELPWGKQKTDKVNIARAEKVLNKSHYGLQKVKDRIIEHMAVMQLKNEQSSKSSKKKGTKTNQKNTAQGDKVVHQNTPTILCFVGPPGVGKTSIGRSIAESMGRDFVKISLGGIRDEAEIRGHRRTYVGAMPGRIISGMKNAGSMNPVFMLDEIDKVGNDFRGDPSSALLEALDPEQNYAFADHYLDLPFDLSQVVFITTANTTDTIPPALRDRLEIIRYAGYTEFDKFQIAKRHLLEKAALSNGLDPKKVKFADAALKKVIQRYTREAGVRELERNLQTIMRKLATQIVRGRKTDSKSKVSSSSTKEFSVASAKKSTAPSTKKSSTSPTQKPITLSVTSKNITDFLGPEKYDIGLTESKDLVGLATGLAWTSAGGEVLFIEVALTPGKGKVQLTGKLGDVMKESAQAALTYVKTHAKELGLKADQIAKTDIHIHVPEGAIPKDGPSAGVTMVTAVVSAFTKIPVKREVAMTGEVTLRGRVLRIGGLKEKSIAAHRAGSSDVIIPKENERDLVDIPKSIRDELNFHPVSNVHEVIKIALKKSPFK